MHTLVIHDNKIERDTIAGHLRQASYRVDVAADRSAANAFLEKASPELVLLSWSREAADIVRRIRSIEEANHIYVIALLDQPSPAAISALFQAGADDFLRKPYLREELLARADAPRRIAKWKTSLVHPGARDLVDQVELHKLNAFKNMGQLVAQDLAALFGELEVAEGWLMAGSLRGACIPMSIAAEQAEIRVSIVVEAKLVTSLAAILLGDEGAPTEAVEDMLREIANTAGGAVKRAAAAENVLVTTGLPVNEAREATRNEMTRTWTARIPEFNTQFGVIGEIRKNTNQRIPIAKLREGMVLTHDLRNDGGALIMPAGTRLTATAVERVSGILGDRVLVDVTSPA